MLYQSHSAMRVNEKILTREHRNPSRTDQRARERSPGLFELESIVLPAEARPAAETITQKLIFSTRVCIYNEAAKHSREHDQWRLSMRLSSFPVVVHQ
jgi:hypothetical protein